MPRRFRILVLLIVLAGLSGATDSLGQELTPTEAQTIAREAYGYGLPMVENYNSMYAQAIDVDGDRFMAPFNTLKHSDRVFAAADQPVVTPNLDVVDSFLWMDLRAEPLVLDVPEIEADRYYSIQLVDLYTFNFEYIGTRTTGNNAGRYLITGPDWEGETPEGVTKVIRSETQFAFAKFRTQLHGSDDVDRVKQIQSQYIVQTLNTISSLPAPQTKAIEFPIPDLTGASGVSFFRTLNFLLQFCPTHPSEVELMQRFARIGLGSGATTDIETFSPEVQTVLVLGMDEAAAAIKAAVPTLKSAEVFGTREYLDNDYMKRAVATRIGLYGNSKEESSSSLYRTDGEGNPLDASQTKYKLRMASEEMPPVNAFWSITMYDGKSQGLVGNPVSRFLINSDMLAKLNRDPDDGVTLYIQQESPGDEQQANWLPAPDGPFYLVMRFYWPKPDAYQGTWSAPLVWKESFVPTATAPTPDGVEAIEEVKPAAVVEEPKPELERPTVWGEPTEVQIAIYIIDVDEVDSADQSFAASVYLQAQWKNPFLRHPGPGPTLRSITDVWNPRLTIVGQQMAWRSYPESVEIQPDGTVIYRQKIWGRFSQPLQLRDFPLDHQELSIHVVAAGLQEEHVKMVALAGESAQGSSIASKFSLPDFDVLSWEATKQPYLVAGSGAGVAGYEMRIQVARQMTFYVLKVIIPLCLIVIMSWLPRWIDPEQSGTNIGISTTAFLTLVAYLFAISVLLPRVSYITRMDRFILLSTLTVFMGLVQTVANTRWVKNERKLLVDRLDRWSRIGYPVILALILAYSFMI